MKDDPARFPIGYIVARAAEGVRWSEVKSPKGNVKKAKISVFFESFVRNSEAKLSPSLSKHSSAKSTA